MKAQELQQVEQNIVERLAISESKNIAGDVQQLVEHNGDERLVSWENTCQTRNILILAGVDVYRLASRRVSQRVSTRAWPAGASSSSLR